MNTDLTLEQISALADGELSGAEIEVSLAALRGAEGRMAWQAYHQIGDALRSDEIVLRMSPAFSSRLFARLEAEPTILAPVMATAVKQDIVAVQAQNTRAAGFPSKRFLMHFAFPGMVAAAAVATVAFIATPQLMVATGSDSALAMPVVAAATQPVLANVALTSQTAAAPVTPPAVAALGKDEVMLRDPQIDDYLFAHQGFSSSIYSTAQFARSATFAANSGK